jgi:hypothetical protein
LCNPNLFSHLDDGPAPTTHKIWTLDGDETAVCKASLLSHLGQESSRHGALNANDGQRQLHPKHGALARIALHFNRSAVLPNNPFGN